MSKSLELQIVSECAPTLAGIKTANLFNYKYSDKEAFILELDSANEELNKKGLYIKALRSSDTSALIYVYRRNLLFKDLNKDEVWNILTDYGYTIRNVDESIKRLEQRLGESVCFPHEIGLFLGYPAEDRTVNAVAYGRCIPMSRKVCAHLNALRNALWYTRRYLQAEEL